ncbi:PepSY domain-containing protein [Opitutaceae bacterium EW11]|nr:PepSY domain-containing protein [Opitutaceae bacterium EW11]
MRRAFWMLHSWLGLAAGVGLLVIGLTGSLLMFRHELDVWLQPELVRAVPSAAGRLPADELLRAAERQLPGYEVTGWLIDEERPAAADLLYVIRHGTSRWLLATLDPYSGRLLATPRTPKQTVSGWLLELHYTFLGGHTGTCIAGVLGAALCLLGVSGLWIYREFWKCAFTLRWGRGARILFSDLHKAVGILSVAFNLALGFTGAYWNLTHIFGHWMEGGADEPVVAGRLYSPAFSLARALADAPGQLPGFRSRYVSLPTVPGGAVTLWGAVEPRGLLRGPYGSTVSYDAATGAFTAVQDLRAASWWRQVVDAFTPLHFGAFGGMAVRLLWSAGGLAPGILAVSGFFIWRSRRRRSRPPARAPQPRLSSPAGIGSHPRSESP